MTYGEAMLAAFERGIENSKEYGKCHFDKSHLQDPEFKVLKSAIYTLMHQMRPDCSVTIDLKSDPCTLIYHSLDGYTPEKGSHGDSSC